MATTDKPYTNLPSYADIDYIDDKLKVARGIIRRTASPSLKNNWMETIDILLDQRLAMLEMEHGDYR